MKCPRCGAISLSDKVCGLCGTRLDGSSLEAPETPVDWQAPERAAVVRVKGALSTWTFVKFVFGLALVPIGWFVDNYDFTDVLASLGIAYVIAFNFAGIAMMVAGPVMSIILIWDGVSNVIPSSWYVSAQRARGGWKGLGVLGRFLIISSAGEAMILLLGWTVATGLGIDLRFSIALILGLFLIAGLGLFPGRVGRYAPPSQRYNRYLQAHSRKFSKSKGQWLMPAVFLLWILVTVLVIMIRY